MDAELCIRRNHIEGGPIISYTQIFNCVEGCSTTLSLFEGQLYIVIQLLLLPDSAFLTFFQVNFLRALSINFPIKKPHFQETRSKIVPAQIPEHPYGELLGLLRNEENYVLPLLQDLANMYQYTMRRQE